MKLKFICAFILVLITLTWTYTLIKCYEEYKGMF
jgi:hypothetical protein